MDKHHFAPPKKPWNDISVIPTNRGFYGFLGGAKWVSSIHTWTFLHAQDFRLFATNCLLGQPRVQLGCSAQPPRTCRRKLPTSPDSRPRISPPAFIRPRSACSRQGRKPGAFWPPKLTPPDLPGMLCRKHVSIWAPDQLAGSARGGPKVAARTGGEPDDLESP